MKIDPAIRPLLFILSLMTLSVQAASASAPLCSQTLISSRVSDASIQATINKIAEFKLELDLAKAQGDTSTLYRLFTLEYDKKIISLGEGLRGKLSETELHDLIAAKIQSLQKEKNQSEKIEIKNRAEERDLAKGYSFSQQVALNTNGPATSLTYLSSRNSIIFTDSKSRQLMMLELQNNQVLPLQKDVMKYFVLNNENALLVLSSKGTLSLLGLNNKESKAFTDIQVQTHQVQDLSPAGKIFATADNINNQLVLIDITNGQHHPVKIKLPDPAKSISAVKFINNQELLLSRFMEQFFYKINIDTGHVEVIEAGSQVIESIHISPDLQNLIFYSKRTGLISIKSSELSDLRNRSGQHVGKYILNLSYMPDGKKLFIIYLKDTLQRGIFGSEMIQDPYFSFPESMNSIDSQIITIPVFDSRNHRIFFPLVSKDPDGNKQYHIEIWRQTP